MKKEKIIFCLVGPRIFLYSLEKHSTNYPLLIVLIFLHVANPCPGFIIPSFGRVLPSDCLKENIETGARCYIKCFKGYKIQGSLVRVCQENSTWSGINSFCKGKLFSFSAHKILSLGFSFQILS